MDIQSFPVYYQGYIELVPKGDPLSLLQEVQKESIKSLAMITEQKANAAYAPRKWSIKDILQHIMDTERIFSYRALSFARGESMSLPGYDHDSYAKNASANERSFKDLLEEWKILRASTVALFKSFDATAMVKKGIANEKELSVQQILMVLIGHELHHIKIIEERYL